MITTLYRIIKYGIQGFVRNGWQSVSTLSVMTLALFVFLSLILFNFFTDGALSVLRDKIDVNVYFRNEVLEDDILKIQRSLESLAEVKSVEYVSKQKALSEFQERHKSDETISQALQVLEENPLSASLKIKAENPEDYSAISAYLSNENIKNSIDQVTYNQNQVVINRLASIVDTVQKSGLALTAILSLIAVLVTLNTIILNIYSTRDEIGIMRLVGAGNRFIRGPYIVQGILYGIIGALISLVLMAPLLSFSAPYLKLLMPEVSIQQYLYSNLFSVFGYQAFFGIALGIFSSVIAVSRYLKI